MPLGVNGLDISSATRFLTIPEGSMKGGSEYKINLMVFDTNNPDISVETEITITTLTKGLEPKISRAPLLQAGMFTDRVPHSSNFDIILLVFVIYRYY